RPMPRFFIAAPGFLALWQLGFVQPSNCAGAVAITTTDRATGKPVACRLHIKDATGKPQRAATLPFWHDHFVCTGTLALDLPAGKYTYECERGPEYTLRKGSFTVADQGPTKLRIELERLADLAVEGWWSGELHIHRPLEDIELLMKAEDLH